MISVIMPVFNAKLYLEESIESILNQSVKNFEFIIINDGSTDNSLDIIRQYKKIDSRIKVINQENQGVTKSLNVGIKISKGKYLARMDADDISVKNRFEEQIKWLEEYNYDFCCSRTWWLEKNKGSNLIYCFIPFKISIKYTNPFIHGTYFFKKSIYDEIGGYNEKYIFSQDYIFMREVIKRGYKIKYLKKILYKSRLLSDGVSQKNKLNQKKLLKLLK